MAQGGEWGRLFGAAFTQSRNAMVLLDGARRQVDANGAYLKLLGYRRADVVGRPIYEFVVGGPIATRAEWEARVRSGQFTGDATMRAADGGEVAVQWAATAEVVTGQHLVLFVALSTSRWGPRFRRASSRSCAWWRLATAARRSRRSCASRTTRYVRTRAMR